MTCKLFTPTIGVLLLMSASSWADDFTATSAQKSVERYINELEEIDRVAALRKTEAKLRLKNALQQAEQFEQEKGRRYRGMLGSYFNHQGRIPFIMLSIPKENNVLGENARGTFNAHNYDAVQPMYKFEAVGHVAIPRDGNYRLEGSRAASIKLNNREYRLGATVAGQPPIADVDLMQGVYKVEFNVGNNGGQMNYSSIRIIDNQTQKELPIFIYETELENFRNDLSFGVKLQETSRWNRQDHLLRQPSRKRKK